MQTSAAFTVGADHQQHPEAIVADRTVNSKACVWPWQRRYMLEGVDGLLHGVPRLPGRVKASLLCDVDLC